MSVLPERFNRIKKVLNCRMENLSILVEDVNKPHNLSAILRTCDAAGVFETNFICNGEKVKTYNSTAQGSQKWIKLRNHKNSESGIKSLKEKGFKLFGTTLNKESIDYRELDFSGRTCFVLGAEKWGLSKEIISQVDESVFIPMNGMVQSLNVSVAASILLFEAVRQRHVKGLIPISGEGLNKSLYKKTLFEWCYPELINSYKNAEVSYPELNEIGEIIN